MTDSDERLCATGRHDLGSDGATYTSRDGRERCRECQRERNRRAKQRRKRAKEKEAPEVVEEQAPTPTPAPAATTARMVRAGSPVQQALYRHAVLVRKQRGLL